MKNYKVSGELMNWVATATRTAGSGVLVGVRLGVLAADTVNGATGVLAMRGVYNLPKLTADVVAQGALLYWDNVNSRLTITSAGNTLAGYAFAAADGTKTTVDISLNG